MNATLPSCPHCPDGHTPPAGGSQPWTAYVASDRDGDGQPTTIHVARSAGAHVAESDAEWITQRLREPKPDIADLITWGEGLAAERDRYREHSVALNSALWTAATALGEVPDRAEQIPHDPTRVERLAAEVERLRAEGQRREDVLAEIRRHLHTAHREAERLRAQVTDLRRDYEVQRDGVHDHLTGERDRKIAAVRDLHRPERGGMGYLPDGGYGLLDGPADEYAVPWPCPTLRALGDTGEVTL